MLCLDATAFATGTTVPELDQHGIHLWFCARPAAPAMGGRDPDAAAQALLAPLLPHYRVAGPSGFARGTHGKPYLAAHAGLDFNLSHSGARALVGFAHEQPLGVDLERLGRRRSELALAQRFFSASESAALSRLSPAQRPRAFLQLWTCKEAVLKALGRGLAFGLDRLEFALDDDGTPTHLQAIHRDGGDVADWHVVALQPAADYLGALAWCGPLRRILGFRRVLADTDHD